MKKFKKWLWRHYKPTYMQIAGYKIYFYPDRTVDIRYINGKPLMEDKIDITISLPSPIYDSNGYGTRVITRFSITGTYE